MTQLDLTLEPPLPPVPPFRGSDYHRLFDEERLTTQIGRVLQVMVVENEGEYFTLAELVAELRRRWPAERFPEASVSAQIRNARKPPDNCRWHTRRRGDPKRGLFEFALWRAAE